MPRHLATIALIALMLAQPLRATDATAPIVMVDAKVDAFAARLHSYVDYCRTSAKPEYAVDCLSERLDFAAASLGNYGWQRDVKAALRASARRLDAVTAKYADPAKPALTLRAANNAIVSARPIQPVARANVTRATAAAAAVLEETQFTLLRSADTSGANALAFAQVAAVVGSAKVLLRSA